MQGVGAAGAATVLGTAVAGAQENTTEDGTGAGQGTGAAIRAVHASPDAPNVDVRVDGNAAIEGLGFGEVSSYSVVEPGTHQVELVVTGGGLDDFLGDLFGDDGGNQDETVLFDTELDVEEGASETLVAYGELAQGPVPSDGGMGNETDGGIGDTDGGMGNETDGGLGDTDGGIGNETDGGLGDTDGGMGNETDGGLGDETDGGIGNDTGGDLGDETGGSLGDETGGGDGATDGEQPLVEGLSYGETATFEVDAGDYTLQVSESAAPGMDGGLGDDTDEGGDGGLGDETDGGMGNETDGGLGDTDGGMGNETDGGLGDTDGGMGNETDGGLGDTDGGMGNETDGGLGDTDGGVADGGLDGSSPQVGTSQGFQVEVLEDEIEDPGEDTARVRVFHAVPDVDDVTISAVGGPEGGVGDTDGGMGNETDGGLDGEMGNETDGGLDGGMGNETDGGLDGDDVGNESDSDLGVDTDGGMGNETDGGLGDGGIDGGVGAGGAQSQTRELNASFSGGTSYSGFAVGYFDPQAAADDGADNETDGGLGGDMDGGMGNDTDGGLGDTDGGLGNDTDGGLGDTDGGLGNETDGDIGDGGTGNETGTGDDLAQDAENPEFELVVVEDAQGGERSDGGTGSGLLGLGLIEA
mgnify:FL=1